MTDRLTKTSGHPQAGFHPAVHEEPESVAASNSNQDDELSERQRADLNDPDKQRRYRLEYLLQILRRQCPGCGEDEAGY